MVSVAFPNPFLRTEIERLAKYIMQAWSRIDEHWAPLIIDCNDLFFAEKEKIVFVYGVNEVVFAIYEADDLFNSWP